MAAIDKILVQAGVLVEAYKTFEVCQHDVEDAVLRMTDAVFTLDSTWNGEASEAFKESFNALKSNLQTSKATLDKAISDLKTSEATYDEVETTLQNLLQSMEDVSDVFANG